VRSSPECSAGGRQIHEIWQKYEHCPFNYTSQEIEYNQWLRPQKSRHRAKNTGVKSRNEEYTPIWPQMVAAGRVVQHFLRTPPKLHTPKAKGKPNPKSGKGKKG
jgi:hypothetical protein